MHHDSAHADVLTGLQHTIGVARHNCACGIAALVAQGSLLEPQVEPVVTAVKPRGDVMFAKRLRRLQPHQVFQALVAATVRWSRSFGLAGAYRGGD